MNFFSRILGRKRPTRAEAERAIVRTAERLVEDIEDLIEGYSDSAGYPTAAELKWIEQWRFAQSLVALHVVDPCSWRDDPK